MPDIPLAWVTVLVSAVVSLVVTLTVEYAAKPGLDARKERILDRERLRRTTEAAVNLAHSNYGMYCDLAPVWRSPEYHQFVKQHRERLRREVGEQALEIVRNGRLLSPDDSLAFEVLSVLAGSLSVFAASGTEKVDDDEISEGVGLALALLRDRRKRDSGLRQSARFWVDQQRPSRQAGGGTGDGGGD